MKIIVDAMGGDNAPRAVVEGALKSAVEFGVEIILVGRGEEILAAMRQCGYETLPKGVEICHADDVVDMHAEAAEVVKQHKGSSMIKGLKMLADGEGDAFISAGNTGALLWSKGSRGSAVQHLLRSFLSERAPFWWMQVQMWFALPNFFSNSDAWALSIPVRLREKPIPALPS